MKKYRDLSIKMKLPLLMGIAGLVVFAMICLLLMRPLRSTALSDSSENAQLIASNLGDRLAQRTRGTAKILRAYSGVISKIAESKVIPNDKKREELLEEIRTLIASEKTLTNVWCVFEPNAFDGLDSLYAGRAGNTANGVFMPWFADDGTLSSAESLASSDMFRLPKSTGYEMFSKPYNANFKGKTEKVISYSTPIMLHGRFIGVIASDFRCEELYGLIEGLSFNAIGKLITTDGIIAVNVDPTRIGEVAEHGNRAILDRLHDRRMFEGIYEFEGKDVYKVYTPIRLGEREEDSWFYAVDIPVAEVYENARTTASYLIFYCILGVLLISLAGWFVIRPMLNSVTGVTDIIRRLSLGHINLNIEAGQSSDEIGTMNGELGKLVDGLKRTADFAHNIGDGKLNAEYQMLSNDDALGNSLLEMRQSLQTADHEHALRAKEEEQRNWVTAGLAKFAEILRRDNDNMESLSYNVISNMVKYLGINQGGIFILNDAENSTEKMLEMKACYAFDRRKFAEKQIRVGEGLVGTCYLEGEPIYMTELPNKYIAITSGLGDANPSALLISPLKVNDEIFGVIELASFKPFEQYQLDFVQKVSESIAATISTVTVNIRTNKLLEQTKLQAEEMANQEEELRQNMEEMQATQEESRRREIELEEALKTMETVQAAGAEKEHEMDQFHNAIFSSNNVIEFSPDLIIADVNQNFLNNLLGGDRSMFIGAHLSKFVGEAEFERIKVSMHQGKMFENVQTINGSLGAKTVRQRFIPLTDNQGKLLKVLLLAFDETHVEEMRQSEEELRQNMEEMQATQEEMRRRETDLAAANYETEQLQNMIFVTSQVATMSPDGIVADVNDNIINAFEGATRDTFVGKPMEAFIGKKELDAVMAHCTRGKMYEMVSNLPTGPNRVTTFRQKFVPICDRDGKLLRVMMVANDESHIEEIRQQEEEMRQNMEEMRATQEEMRRREEELAVANAEIEFQVKQTTLIMNESKTGLWDLKIVKGDPTNPKNVFTWSNEFRQLLGYSNETDFPNIFSSWSDKLHPEDKEKTLTAFERHILDHSGKTPYNLTYRLLKKNGEYGFYHAFGATTRDKDGNAIRVTGAIQDISEETNRTFEMTQLEEMIYKACNVVVSSPEGIVIDVNDKLCSMFGGADKSAFVGQHMSAFTGAESFKKIWADVTQGRIHENTQDVDTGVGGIITYHQRFMPICDKNGKLLRVLELTDPEMN